MLTTVTPKVTAMSDMTDLLSNNPPRCANRDEAMRLYGKLGEQAAAGAMKGSEFLEMVAENVRLQLHEVNPKEAQALWAAFREKQVKKMGNLTADAAGESNFKQRASDVSSVMQAAAIPGVNLNDVFTTARPLIVRGKEDGVHKMNTFDAFVAIARAQKAQIDRQLTDADIEAALQPKAKTPKERNEVISLKAIIKALEVHIHGTNDTDKGPGKEGYPSERAEAMLQLAKEQITLLEFNATMAKGNSMPLVRAA